MRSNSSLSYLSHDRTPVQIIGTPSDRGQLERDENYPFSAQYRAVNGQFGWYIFDASTGGWGSERFDTAGQCQRKIEAALALAEALKNDLRA